MKISALALSFAVVLVAAGCTTPGKDPALDGVKAPATNAPVATNLAPAASTPSNVASMPSAMPTTGPSSSPTPSDAGGVTTASTNGLTGLATGKTTACTSDADCRSFASYCAESPCVCRVLTKSEADPTCVGSGPKVQCLINPCQTKAVHCQANTCVLTAKGPAGATVK